jgi:hypothetical protein
LIDRRRHSSILDVRSFRAADCDIDHYVVMAKVKESLAVSKRTTTKQQNVAQFRYLEMTITNRTLMQEETKRRLKSSNPCCHTVQNILSSRLLSQHIKIRIYKTIVLPIVLYGCETWSLTLREEHGLEGVGEQAAEENIWIEER